MIITYGTVASFKMPFSSQRTDRREAGESVVSSTALSVTTITWRAKDYDQSHPGKKQLTTISSSMSAWIIYWLFLSLSSLYISAVHAAPTG